MSRTTYPKLLNFQERLADHIAGVRLELADVDFSGSLPMEWNAPFIVYRLNADNTLEEVFHADDLKKAKYWLTYIAKPGDVLCKTPAHPKHTKSSRKPEYWSHKETSGQPAANEQGWKKLIAARCEPTQIQFPEEQLTAPSGETV